MSSIRVRGLAACYGDVRVISGLDLDVESGRFAAVLGASGSGKTTLLRVIAGFLRPMEGSVEIGDRVVASGSGAMVPPERRHIGYVPQEGALFPHLDVSGNVGFGLPRGSHARIEEVLELVGMRDALHARPHELSGGQQQRVALARALAPRPDVLLLDEPFAALDASLRSRLRLEVRDLLRSLGTTALLVTHDQEEALSTADTIAVMRDGRLVQVGTPFEVYDKPHDLGVAQFVGDAVMLPGVATGAGTVVCSLGEIPVRESAPGDVMVVLRPEQISLTVCEESASDECASSAVVTSVSYRGHDAMVRVRLEDGSVVEARQSVEKPIPRPGDHVAVQVRSAARAWSRQ